MKQLIIALVLCLAAFGAGAQQDKQQKIEQLRAYKVSYITEQIKLSNEQSAKFWPIYKEYETERRDVRKAFVQKYKTTNKNANWYDEQAMKYVDDNLDYQQQELTIKRKYKDQLLKVISPAQLAALYDAERDFKKILIQKLKD